MKLVLYGLYDSEAQLFDHQIFPFVDERVAFSSFRRSIREGLLAKSLSKDWITEHRYVYLGTLDTATGDIDTYDGVIEPKYKLLLCSDCIIDLVEE